MTKRGPVGARSGLTLLEVMIAVFIVSLTFTYLMTASTRALKTVRMAKEFEIARNLLERLKKEEPLQLDEVDGDDRDGGRFDDKEYRDYRWERELTQVGEESDQFYLVKTRIIWESDDRKKQEQVVEYLHLPTAIKKKWISDKAKDD